jgi:hypothetical protein
MSKGGGVSIPLGPYDFQLGSDGTTIQADYGLDAIAVKSLPTFEIDVQNLPKVVTSSDVSIKEIPKIVTSSDITTKVAITEIPTITTDLNVAIIQIPEQRVHLPAHFQLGFSLLGVELWNLSLCGEAQVINEKYVPRRTEECH